jgi:hypothetical protein
VYPAYTNDVLAQEDAVGALLRQAADGEMVLVTNSLVLAAIRWVLESYYQRSQVDIRDKVLAVLNTPGLEVVDGDLLSKRGSPRVFCHCPIGGIVVE